MVRSLGREVVVGVWPAWVISFWDLVGDFHGIWGKYGMGVATALVASPPLTSCEMWTADYYYIGWACR